MRSARIIFYLNFMYKRSRYIKLSLYLNVYLNALMKY